MSAPEGIDAATGEITESYRLSWKPMNAEQALHATTQINAYAIRLPVLVKEAKEAEAWKALGCSSWTEYVEEKLVISTEYARLLLRGYDKLEELAAGTGVPVDLFTIPERVLRAVDTPTMVGVGAGVVAGLPAGTEPAEQAAVIDKAVRAKVEEQRMEEAAQRGREKAAKDLAEANARRQAAEQQEELARLRRQAERQERKDAEAAKAAKIPTPPPASDPQQEDEPAAEEPGEAGADTPSDAAAPGTTDGTGQPAAHSDGEAGDTVPPTVSPAETSLPDGWRDRLAGATYLLGLEAAAVAAHATSDDDVDLLALSEWLGDFRKARRTIKEQNA